MNVSRFSAAAVLALIIAGPGRMRAQAAATPVPPHPVAASKTDAGRVPPFLKVDGVYILDGGDDDFVKVLELSDTGWMRVQAKNGESWVNIGNLTTIMPVSPELAAKSQMHAKADFIRDGAQQISDAIDAWATKNNAGRQSAFTWADVRKFLKPGTPVYESGGKDASGRPYQLGPTVADHVKVSPDTIKELSLGIGDSDAYWGRFKP